MASTARTPTIAADRLTRLDIVEQLVNDAVGADLDPGLLGSFARLGLGADVESDDYRTCDVSERYVVLVDASNGPMDDRDVAALTFDLADRLAQSFERSLGIGFDDDVELGVFSPELLEKSLEQPR